VDAIILQPLHLLYEKCGVRQGNVIGVPQSIMTRESNQGIFNNWIMAFEPRHPFLLQMINYCFKNVGDVSSQKEMNRDILVLTGPLALTAVLKQYCSHGIVDLDLVDGDDGDGDDGDGDGGLSNFYCRANKNTDANDIYNLSDEEFNMRYGPIGLTIYNKDMGEFARCKNRYSYLLYGPHTPHWRSQSGT
jgi:hypothetical protein